MNSSNSSSKSLCTGKKKSSIMKKMRTTSKATERLFFDKTLRSLKMMSNVSP